MRFLKKYHHFVFVSALIVVGLVFFSPVFDFQFFSDDWDLITYADQYDSFEDRFTLNDHQTTEGYSYRPMVGIYLSVLKSFFGLNPTGYHAFFVLVHVFNAFLVFLLAKRVLKEVGGWYWVSVLASFLFLVLPAHGEAVFWISAGADVAATAFYLLSLLSFLQYLDRAGGMTQQNQELGIPASEQVQYGAGRNDGFSSFIPYSLFFILSFVFFILGLLTKEIVITLPLALIVLFIWFFRQEGQRVSWKNLVPVILPFFIFAGFYVFIRWKTTGTIFGYYGRESVGLDFGNWIRMASDLLSSFFTWGDTRLRLAEVFKEQFHWFVVLLAFIIFYIKRHCEAAEASLAESRRAISSPPLNNEIAARHASLAASLRSANTVARNDRRGGVVQSFSTFCILFVISMLPVLPLGFNTLSDEGERYGYLPSVFFVMAFAYVLYLFFVRHSSGISDPAAVAKASLAEEARINRTNGPYTVYVAVSLIFLVYFGYGLYQKMNLWQTYQTINYQILNQLYQLNDSPRFGLGEAGGRKIIIAGLPDSYHGVQAFRNGIEEAYGMYYGEKIEIIRIPVYTIDGGRVNYELRIKNQESRIKQGGRYSFADGFDEIIPSQLFLKTQDTSLRLTGEKEYEDEYVDIEFFRWHYDISRADGVTMKLKDRLLDDVQNGKASLLLHDGTRLVRVL